MGERKEIKLEKEGFLLAKVSFDNKIENIRDTKNAFDNGIDLLHRSWIGKAKNSYMIQENIN